MDAPIVLREATFEWPYDLQVSVRTGLAYRALCVKEEDALIRYWIGAHDDYMRLISGREGV